MEKKVKGLSFFLPALNEVGNIELTIEKATPTLKEVAEEYEIIVIDDGSTDGTESVVKKIAQRNSHVKLIRHKYNLGYGAALNSGFNDAKYELIVFNDGDGQFDFGEVKRFLAEIKEYDFVIGYRLKRVDPFLRRLLQFLLKIWALGLFGLTIRDIDCGFKLIRREALKKILPFKSTGAMISTEILFLSKKKKLKIKEIPVSHYPRKVGRQTGGNIDVILKAIIETYYLKNRNYD